MVVDQKDTFKYPVDGLWYFKMGKYEVTNAEYASFLNENKIGSDGIWNGWKDAENKSKVLVRQYAKFGLIWDAELAEWKPADGYCDCPVVNVSCRCAARAYCSPRVTNMLIGFRVAFDQNMKWE